MNATDALPAAALTATDAPPLGRMLWLETRCELLKLLRLPVFVLPTVCLPVVFYLLFGVAFGGARSLAGTTVGAYMVATYGCFGVLAATLFSLGVGIATERGQGWLLFKRATPMPLWVHFTARVAVSLMFAAVIVVLLSTAAIWVGGVRLPAATWLRLAAVLVAGGVPFTVVGLAFGYLLGPNSAPGVINLVLMPLSFASGFWIPVEVLPGFFQGLAPYLPTYHFAQLALSTLGAARQEHLGVSVAILAATAAIFAALAAWGFRRDDGTTYG